jgi:hypothetical protein
MVVLCVACAEMKKKTSPKPVKETIDLEDPELEQRLSDRFNACKSMNELTYHFICVFGDELGGGLSTAEIYNFVKYFKTDWTVKGPRGGTSLRKTIYAVCANGVKKKNLVKIKKNRRVYYDIAKESEV